MEKPEPRISLMADSADKFRMVNPRESLSISGTIHVLLGEKNRVLKFPASFIGVVVFIVVEMAFLAERGEVQKRAVLLR